MSSGFIKTARAEQPWLYQRILDFNHLPTRYLHPSWIVCFASPHSFKTLCASPRGERKLAALILKRYQLTQVGYFDFAEDAHRLALVDAVDLRRAVLWCGIAALSEEIAKVVDRQRVHELVEDLGLETHRFALTNARRYSNATLFASWAGEGDIAARAWMIGTTCLTACFSERPDSLRRRLRLFFPRESGFDFRKSRILSLRPLAAELLTSILIREVNPQWSRLFN